MGRDTTSQVKFWIEGLSGWNNNEGDGQAAQFLDYDVFLGLSVLGGFFALDHLYLRSPLTFLAKLAVNFFCFGLWWIYDALHAIFNTDVVKIYGLGVPGLGPRGIGAGVLANDEPSRLHMNFFYYALALLFGGLIGLHSFILGYERGGIFRLIATISFIFLPLSLLVWGFDIIRFFVDTENVVNENSSYFGAPYRSISSRLVSRFPFLGWLFNPVETFKSFINNIIGPGIVQPITATIDGVTGVVDKTVSTAREAIKLGKTTVETIGESVDKLGAVASMSPMMSLYSDAEKLGVNTKNIQKGGSLIEKNLTDNNSLNLLPYTLLGTICFIALGGFIATIYRSKDVSSKSREKDDAPPKPGVFRNTDSAKSSSTA